MGSEDSLKPESQDNRTKQTPPDRSHYSTTNGCYKAKHSKYYTQKDREKIHKRNPYIQIKKFTKTDWALNFFSLIVIVCYCFSSASTYRLFDYFIIDLRFCISRKNFKHEEISISGQNTEHLLLRGASYRATAVIQKKLCDHIPHAWILKHFNNSNCHLPKIFHSEYSSGPTKWSRGRKNKRKKTPNHKTQTTLKLLPYSTVAVDL